MIAPCQIEGRKCFKNPKLSFGFSRFFLECRIFSSFFGPENHKQKVNKGNPYLLIEEITSKMVGMVTPELLEKSYRTRPRKSVAVKGFFHLLFSVAILGFYLLYLMNTSGPLFGWMDGIAVNLGDSASLGDVFYNYGLFFLLPLIVTFIPFCIGVSINGYRRSYWWFSIFEIILAIALFGGWVLYFIPMVRDMLPLQITDFLSMALPYVFFALCGVYLLQSFFMLLYPALPCGKYKEIYRLKKARLEDTHRENYKGPSRSSIRHSFYVFYKKKKWAQMMDLLYAHVFEKARSEQLDQGEFAYYVEAIGRVDSSIRKAELDYLFSHRQFPMIGKIYDRLVAQSKMPDIGEKRATEDHAMLDFLEKKAQSEKPASVVTPLKETPSPIGEAWK